jgi:hypothetical protein
MGRVRADRWQSETLGDHCDDRNSSIGRNGEHAVDPVLASYVGHRVEVREVHRFSHIGRGKARRLGVPVDRDDAQAAAACLLDRTPLMASRAYEEDGLHGRRW